MQQQIISLVVAMNNERVIGVNNTLPWHIPEDLQHFRQLTLGKPIIMGRKTYESIGKPLPKRTNIVITRDTTFNAPGVICYSSVPEALQAFSHVPEVCIIGGAQIFALSLAYINVLHLTTVDVAVHGQHTILFPPLDLSSWRVMSESNIITQSGIKCNFISYTKILGRS